MLFDELEKAHPDVAAILLQILDDGRVTDAKGRTIDFRHALIVLTTNLEDDELAFALRPELLDRIDEIVAFARARASEKSKRSSRSTSTRSPQRLGARNVPLELSDEAQALPRPRLDGRRKRRALRQRTVSHYVSTPLSTALLRGELRRVSGRR